MQIPENDSVLSPICRKDRFIQDNLLNYNMAKMLIDKINFAETNQNEDEIISIILNFCKFSKE